MYTFLINEDNTVYASVTERIMERSKLVDKIHFLADVKYKDIDMSDFTLVISYVLPISKRYKTEVLSKSEELYKGKLEYVFPVDTNITSEAGDIEFFLTFTNVEMTTDGETVQMVRKAGPGEIKIVPIGNWDIVPDSALAAIDQRILALDAMAKALGDRNNVIMDGKADSLSYKDNLLQLVANGKPIGNTVRIESKGETVTDPDGALRVVEF